MRSLSAVAVLAIAIGTTVVLSQDRQTQPGTTQPGATAAHDKHFEDCARACDDCARICELCAAHCGNMLAEGKKEHHRTLQTCQDCATACAAASCITARKGPFSDLICQACADACKRCGDACDQHPNDPLMKRCADECRKCEAACREMLKHTGKVGGR